MTVEYANEADPYGLEIDVMDTLQPLEGKSLREVYNKYGVL